MEGKNRYRLPVKWVQTDVCSTQDERYQKFILQYVEKMTEEWENAFSKTDVTKKINAGSAWIFAYEKTGEEKYKEYIERMKDDLMGLSRTAEGSCVKKGIIKSS